MRAPAMSAASWLANVIAENADPRSDAWRKRVHDLLVEAELTSVAMTAETEGWCRRCDGAGELKACKHGNANCPCELVPCPECGGG